MIITQSFVSKSTKQTEGHAYKVIEVHDQFEIRKYEPALFSGVKLTSKGYKESCKECSQICTLGRGIEIVMQGGLSDLHAWEGNRSRAV